MLRNAKNPCVSFSSSCSSFVPPLTTLEANTTLASTRSVRNRPASTPIVVTSLTEKAF